MFARKLLRCSFCGKDETQVSKLVAGPKVFICDACTTAAARIIESNRDDSSPPRTSQTPRWRSVLSLVWRLVRGQPLHRMDRRASDAL
jgi:ATP-dependent Clp protease ATP-binding subunit ClpX